MARPQKLKEAELNLIAEAPEETVSAINNGRDGSPERPVETLEDTSDAHGDSEVLRTAARQLGWVDQTEWTRDPEMWVDERRFLLEQAPRKVNALEDRLKRVSQVNDQIIADTRARARADAEAEFNRARSAGDIDAAIAAQRKFDANNGPSPVASEWEQRNPWYSQDPVARAAAIELSKSLALRGVPVEEQLAQVEKEVRRRFPEHFVGASPIKAAPSARTAPSVQPGARGPTIVSRSKEKGWGDIPAAERAEIFKTVKKISNSHGLPIDEAQKKYARVYWSNKGEY